MVLVVTAEWLHASPGVVRQVCAEVQQGEPGAAAGGVVGAGLRESYGEHGGSERVPDDHAAAVPGAAATAFRAARARV
ncbi:hypothetical protein ACFFHJ_33085 [Planotetraspora thailandica]|uniref:hypothetical protein n=1 Tax=Planotetraspora thailandica TaxID=487172 RepID=UPI0019512E5E|nr:hypothetical protein [Planotetraspora thailandica]